MLRTITMLAVFATLATLCGATLAAEPAKIRVLLITGDDVGAHPWREISESVRADLVKSGKFDVKVCEDPAVLDSATVLKPYDAIVFTIYTTKATPMITDQAKENLLNYVKEGKGFFVQHLATASFASWDEFGKLCGRKWVMGKSGHGPRSVFEAKITKKDHAITKGMENFKVDDELYAKLQGDTPIDVLVEADSDWSKKTEPLVWTLPYGKGRVVHSAFGHDGKVMENPNVAKIICRGVEFAATGKVAE